MSQFMGEMYLARGDVEGLRRAERSARAAAEQLAREGTDVRYLRSLFVPDDETFLCVYEAASADTVREAGLRAALTFDRVAEAITDAEPRPRE